MPKATKAQADAFNTLLLKVSSPERAAQFIATAGEIDVRDLLAQVRVPTLVLHARDDRWSRSKPDVSWRPASPARDSYRFRARVTSSCTASPPRSASSRRFACFLGK